MEYFSYFSISKLISGVNVGGLANHPTTPEPSLLPKISQNLRPQKLFKVQFYYLVWTFFYQSKNLRISRKWRLRALSAGYQSTEDDGAPMWKVKAGSFHVSSTTKWQVGSAIFLIFCMWMELDERLISKKHCTVGNKEGW